ncbi:MAG: carboxypeptidase-like regulatory domain-containing protein, partial [Bacteroidota bacterium]
MKKRLRHLMLFATVLLMWSSSTAQQKTITGHVNDSLGKPLQGVTVKVKGKSMATATGSDGSFTILAKSNDILEFSFTGYMNKEIQVSSLNNIVTLNPNISNLNEVVVVGYGTATKKDITGSVSAISSKDFQKGQISTPEQMIAGKLPGVSIISNGGQPGSGSTIRIRGGSSIRASNDP